MGIGIDGIDLIAGPLAARQQQETSTSIIKATIIHTNFLCRNMCTPTNNPVLQNGRGEPCDGQGKRAEKP